MTADNLFIYAHSIY